MNVPRGVRNNNPGNIIKSGIEWQGEKESLDETRFEVFDTPEHGLLALAQNLINYQERHGCKTIRQIIDRWAPPVENNTEAYIASVVATVGVGADAAVDIHDPRILAAIAVAIIKVENGSQPYPAAMVEAAVNEALGITDTQPAAPIEDASPAATPEAAPASSTETPMGAGLILGLVQTALQAFAPLAQQKITRELVRHTDQATADAVAQQVMAAIQQATGQTGTTPQAMIAATAAITKPDAPPVVVQAAETDALARLGDMAPFIDKLAEYQRQEWAASEDSMDRAAARNPTGYDMTRPLVYAALGAGGVILLTLMAALVIYALNKQALPEMLLTLIVQTVTGFLGFIALLFAFRFGSSRSSAAKDEMIAQVATRRRTDK